MREFQGKGGKIEKFNEEGGKLNYVADISTNTDAAAAAAAGPARRPLRRRKGKGCYGIPRILGFGARRFRPTTTNTTSSTTPTSARTTTTGGGTRTTVRCTH